MLMDGRGKLTHYVRKATWQESMFATRQATARREAELRQRGDGDSPWPGVSLGQWWSIPLSAETIDRQATYTDVPFPPEQGPVDVTKSCGELSWTKRPDIKSFGEQQVLDAPGYLFREIHALEPTTICITLTRGGGGTRVWLNGETVFRFERAVDFAGYDNNLRLHLQQGENQLLVKLTTDAARSHKTWKFGIKPVPAWKANRKPGVPAPESLLAPLFSRLARDFTDPLSRRQMLWEREDDIWDGRWDEIAPSLAQRYAAAANRRGGGKLIGTADANDADAMRNVYYLACRIWEAHADHRLTPRAAGLRLAIEDLITTFGPRYPKGKEYLARIDALLETIEATRGAATGGDLEAATRFAEAVDRFLDLRREALLANPLLDFDRLLVVKRFCSYTGIKGDNGVEPGQPVSWASQASLNTHGWENEIAVLSPVRPGGKLTTVYRPTGTQFVGDVDLEWDGDRMLFSSIREPGRWQVFEVGIDGRGLREAIRDRHPDVDNFDPCYLPDGRVVFNSTAALQAVPCSPTDRVANLYRAEANGTGIRRLCFDQDQDYTPAVLHDGRVIYTRWEYADTAHVFARLLFSMNPDGTNQMALYGSNSYWPTSIWYARSIPGHPTKLAAIVSGHHGCRRRGPLVIFDPARGRYEADGAVQMIGRRGQPIEPILLDSYASNTFPTFLHPYPLSEKYLLAACRPTPNSQWAIYLVDVFDNMLPLVEDAEYALYEPIPVRKTLRPSVVPDRIDLEAKDATILLTDVYRGPGLKGVPRGTVKRLRVYSFVYAYHLQGNYSKPSPVDARRILGSVPVEADGSAHFRVPANTPLAVQPLDAEGRALQVMRSWYTAMPGERASCIGCHEPFSESAPPEATLAALKPAAQIEPWRGPERPFSFRQEVLHVLARRCAGCHHVSGLPKRKSNPEAPGLSADVLRHYVRHVGSESDYRLKSPGEYYAESSELVQMFRKGHHGVELDDDEFDRLVTWIDLNTPEFGTWAEKSRGQVPFNQCERRCELQTKYAGLNLDINAYPEPAPPPGEPIIPEPDPPGKPVACPNWPLTRSEAQRRQHSAGPATERRIELGESQDGKPIYLDLVLIPSGEFVMGNPRGLRDERPATRVKITRPFWMTRHEISNGFFALFDASHDSYVYDTHPNSHPKGPGEPLNGSQQPVVRVTWREAMAFCRWLSDKTGDKFSLPTEAQWEWACRAGSDAPLWFGKLDANYTKHANVADQAFSQIKLGVGVRRVCDRRFDDGGIVTMPCGHYAANPWGLHDMHGNVAEWTRSAYRAYPYDDSDGRNNSSPDGEKVIRGGSFHDRPHRCCAAFRNYLPAWLGAYDVGFRVICEVP
jgi:formylglycine-generating enzyme required for sulfatase activity